MSQHEPFDLAAYFEKISSAPCFICEILEGRDETHHIIYRDNVALVFLSKYPPLYGYTLVAPAQHLEQVTGDFSLQQYLALQRIVYATGEALRRELPTERLYILSLGSQQGNRHVHWHVAALPPGVPLERQQLELLHLKDGYLKIDDAELTNLSSRLSHRMAALVAELEA